MKKLILWSLILFVVGAALMRPVWRGSSQSDAAAPELDAAAPASEQIVERFKLEGFDISGDQAWKLLGDRGHIGEDRDVFIEKNVVLTLQGDTLIKADKVLWQGKKSRFLTNQPVNVDHKDIAMTGIGASGKLEEKFLQINQNIRALTTRGTIITCRGPMKVFYGEERIALYRDVQILDLKGGVFADRMMGYFDPEEKQLIRVVAEGNVKISKGDDVSYADKAVYDTRTGSVRLEGAPEINIRNAENLQVSRDEAGELNYGVT